MQFLIIAIVFAAVMYVLGTYVIKRKLANCEPPIIKFRPLVRTFIEEQESPPSVFKMFQNMFWKTSGWWSTKAHSTQLNQNKIQPYAYGELPGNKIQGKRENDHYLGQFFG